ncbi:acetate/propionate family kinase [Candidatus Omnitrophota bacterium]
MLILVLNCGSSSVKYQLYQMPKEVCLAKGMVDELGQTQTIKALVKTILENKELLGCSAGEIAAVGHRLVHGGEEFKQSVLINRTVIKAIKRYSKLAPLHNPPNLAGIYAAQSLLPKLPQIAVFDTAFYQSMPACAYLYGLPYEVYQKYGIRRYGFHGMSHRYVSQQAAKILGQPLKKLKIITCHLGNGCSITAVDRGRAIDTSMGFTPLEGLVMGTRSGDVDPAAVLFLMKKMKLSIARTGELLNKASGLLGLSGKSSDFRDIEAAARSQDKRAKLALAVFIYRIKKYIGAYIAALNGCDALVLTGGIGENSTYIRKKITQGLSALLTKFKTRILVIPTNEELVIARDTYENTR